MAEVSQHQQGARARKSRLKPVLFAVAIIVAAGAAGGALRWFQLENQRKYGATPTAVQQKVIDTQNTALSGDYDKAHEALESALDNPKLSLEDRQSLVNQQGVTYENQGKFKEAEAAFKQAFALKENQAIAESIGRVAEKQNDKETAIAYYKKAITLIPKDNPIGEDDANRYRVMISNLGGTE